VPEVATQNALLETGEADIALVTAEQAVKLEKAGLRVIVNPGGRVYHVALGSQTLPTHENFEPHGPWWADPANTAEWERAKKVRMAMNLAVDRQEILDKIFMGYAQRLPVMRFPPGLCDITFESYPYEPEKAKQLLAEAGYPDGFELTMSLLKHGGRPEAPDIAEAVAMYWEDIGLKVNRVPRDWATLKPIMYERKLGLECWPYGGGYFDEPIMTIYKTMTSKVKFHSGVEYPPLDELADQAFYELDKEKRWELCRQWAKICYDNYFNVPVAAKANLYVVSDRVKDWPVVPGMGYPVHQLEYLTFNR
jgi:peptide/nickel transport system substrate-binding protein